MEAKGNASHMSEKNRPKYSFSKKLGGGEFPNVAVWPRRSNPEDEVASVQLRKFDGTWKTLARLALYRTWMELIRSYRKSRSSTARNDRVWSGPDNRVDFISNALQLISWTRRRLPS